jgi:hypothetical protein
LVRSIMSGGRSDRSVCWTLEGTTARLQYAGLSGALELVEPWGGLHQLSYLGLTLRGWLLGVAAEATGDAGDPLTLPTRPWTPSDSYVRGCDLVALYGETAERPFSLQVYWRVHEPAGGEDLTIDAIVSVQTRAWEAFPEVCVSSALTTEAVEIVRSDARVIGAALRPEGASWSYVETSPPGDFVASQVEVVEGDMRRIAWRFGRQFMERGVIRRLRLRAAFVPRQRDEERVKRLQAELASEEPPLTA